MTLTIGKIKGCPTCGSKLVYIRGKYPQSKKRKVCPTCAVERLEQIQNIVSDSYGRTFQENTMPHFRDSIVSPYTPQNL